MKLSTDDYRRLNTLLSYDKPVQRIVEYLTAVSDEQSTKHDQARIDSRVELLNKSYKNYFDGYYKSFIHDKAHREDCIIEAYAATLKALRKGVEYDVALLEGHNAGGLYYTELKKAAREVANNVFIGGDTYGEDQEVY